MRSKASKPTRSRRSPHDLPADVVDEVREGLNTEERAQLRAAMSYPEGSVGALMDFEMITIREDVTLEVVLRYLRRFDELPDHTDQVFVVDRARGAEGRACRSTGC